MGTSLRVRLLFGPLAAAVFVAGVIVLAHCLPGYSHVRQTISVIGAMDSPLRVPFAIFCGCVAVCLWVFATAVREVAVHAGRSALAAYLIAFVGLTEIGLGVFATPHPYHNLIGPSALIGFQAPAVLAWAWRKDPAARRLVAASWVCWILLWVAALANLAPALLPPPAGDALASVIGLAQRALFLTWFGWCALTGVLLWRAQHAGPSAPPTLD